MESIGKRISITEILCVLPSGLDWTGFSKGSSKLSRKTQAIPVNGRLNHKAQQTGVQWSSMTGQVVLDKIGRKARWCLNEVERGTVLKGEEFEGSIVGRRSSIAGGERCSVGRRSSGMNRRGTFLISKTVRDGGHEQAGAM